MSLLKRQLLLIFRPVKPFWRTGGLFIFGAFIASVLTASIVHTIQCKNVHYNLSYFLFKSMPGPQQQLKDLEQNAKPEVIKRVVLNKKIPLNIEKLSLTRLNGQISQLGLNSEFDRLSALNDPLHRIDKEFKVPKALRLRIGFWFDIYTLYGTQDHVFHHAIYPWIVFDTINTEYIDKEELHKWTKYHKKKRVVQKQRALVKRTLLKLANRKSYRHLKGLEKQLYDRLKTVRGRRSKVFKTAYYNLRTQLGQRDFMLKGIINSRKYLPHMEKIFEKQNLPTELTRMPFVESSFNENAFSKVGASGIWQIMPRSGRESMMVNDIIDERNSPLKATEYAAHHLKRDYRALKSWPLTITAYNHGIGNLRQAQRKMKTSNIATLISKYNSDAFQFASKNFFTSFIAVLHAEAYHDKIFSPMQTLDTQEIEYVQLKKPIRITALLSQLGMSANELFHLNLDLEGAIEKNRKLPKGFKVILPKGKTQFLDSIFYTENLSRNKKTI